MTPKRRMGPEEDIWWESSTSPGKRKRKKESKKSKNAPKSKGSIPAKAEHRGEKEEKKDTKQRKKKKKKKCVDFNTLIGDTHHTSQRKRKVGFDLSSSYILVKDPDFASFSPKVNDSLHHQRPLQEDDSQWEDINSQDLFITQKIFRASPSDSEDTSTPAMTTQHAETWRHSLNPRKKKWPPKKGKAGAQNRNCSFRTDGDFHASLASRSGEVADASPRVAEHSKCANAWQTSLKETASTSTQTQNFFTAPPLSSYACFSHRTRPAGPEDVKPLDLSLPHRARRGLGGCLARSDATEEDTPSPGPGEERAPSRKDLEVKTEAAGEEKRGKGDTMPSPPSESESKSTSSDCNPAPCRSTKVDLNQVRPVQMRLNESFFFKTKGYGCSPRPESPLVKLTDGRASQRDKKGKKGR
ncbi:uncharacterized protein LOC129181273 isoform X2 [Dunckerocampus dactyliophorus]|uniref:uncharacterized protein LOC129181273 isoform X2 n=1 Tax=Dunckerocampus dactyliophorus TaxID=161453 RepID=UPI002406A27A|nr:uncharacterized protein LOC129181273 isoform X2 [Dunckerocampus dactyliophorus]